MLSKQYNNVRERITPKFKLSWKYLDGVLWMPKGSEWQEINWHINNHHWPNYSQKYFIADLVITGSAVKYQISTKTEGQFLAMNENKVLYTFSI